MADVGASNDLAKPFTKSCHVAVYGVLFDFNKASLKAQSDGVLQRVLAFLQQDATLKLEVQGRTDNVGCDDYKQQLSEARLLRSHHSRMMSEMRKLKIHERLSLDGLIRPSANDDNFPDGDLTT